MENIVLDPESSIKSPKTDALHPRSSARPRHINRKKMRVKKAHGCHLFRSMHALKAAVDGSCLMGAGYHGTLYDPVDLEADRAAQFALLCRQYHMINSEFACIFLERNELRERVEELEEENRRLKAALYAL